MNCNARGCWIAHPAVFPARTGIIDKTPFPLLLHGMHPGYAPNALTAQRGIRHMAPMSADELFVIGFDAGDRPIRKAVTAMTDAEQTAALDIALEAFKDAEAELEPLMPLVQVEYLPATLVAAKAILKRLQAYDEVYTRMQRLADAVIALGAH
jgi:hypothetical protein